MSLRKRNDTSRRSSGESDAPVSSLKASKTLTWMEIPEWQRDNDYILTGYRRVQNSWVGCFISVFSYIHNETVNIHSHLGGALVFLFFLTTFHSTYISAYQGTTWLDSAVFSIFLSSAVFCLSASAFFHTSTCHSKNVSARCHALDYSGIVILTVGSFFPCIYYGFFCEPHFQVLWLLTITFAGLGASYIVLNPEYAKPTHREARTKVFVGLGLSAIAPVTQLLVSHSFNKLLTEMGFGFLLTSGALYITGALLYANRIPERLAPGKFDYFFSSHQIFHTLVPLKQRLTLISSEAEVLGIIRMRSKQTHYRASLNKLHGRRCQYNCFSRFSVLRSHD